VTGSPLRAFTILAAACAAVFLALPVASGAHQAATLSGGLLTITGDQLGKLNDLVTVEYDASRDELVIGNDIFAGHPSECAPDAAHPQRIFRCPAALVSAIRIETGTGSDAVIVTGLASVPVQAVMGGGKDSFTGGPEVDSVSGGGGGDKAELGAGDDSASMGGGSDKADLGDGDDGASMGGGSDKAYGGPGADAIKGGGASDKLFGEGGADSLFGGGAADKLLGGPGADDCLPGPGVGKQIGC
jgi:Ca2+-binding RTX toxin-like protein